MISANSLYSRYTTTSALANDDPAEHINWSRGYFRAHLAPLLPPERNAAILDLACGYGKNLSALADMGYTNARGVDISPEQVSRARQAGLRNVEQADAFSWLADRPESFDCVLAIDFLEHLATEALLALMDLVRRSLKAGGTLVVHVPNALAPLNPIVYGDLTHVRPFTVQSLQQLFLHCGFEPLGYRQIPPHVHGLKSGVRRLLWSLIVRPTLHACMTGIYGKAPSGGIYTANFTGVARVL